MDFEPDDRDGFVTRASNLGISAPRTLAGLQQLLTNALDVYNGLLGAACQGLKGDGGGTACVNRFT